MFEEFYTQYKSDFKNNQFVITPKVSDFHANLCLKNMTVTPKVSDFHANLCLKNMTVPAEAGIHCRLDSRILYYIGLTGIRINHNLKILLLIITIIYFFPGVISAQSANKYNRNGVDAYKKNDYQKAEEDFRKAREKDTSNYDYNYNLGDALYKQEKYDSAAIILGNISNKKIGKDTLSKIYYNQGNSFFKRGELLEKKYDETGNKEQNIENLKSSIDNVQKSIDSYKYALRNNPHSNDARYNLAYANRKLEELMKKLPKEQNKSDSKQNSKNKDKNEDKKQQNKEQKKNGKDNKSQQQTNQDNQNQQGSQNEKQPRMSRQEAQQLLQALSQDEKKLIKQRLKKAKSNKIKTTKPW